MGPPPTTLPPLPSPSPSHPAEPAISADIDAVSARVRAETAECRALDGNRARRVVGRKDATLRVGEHRLDDRSEEHTSELQSRQYLVCRLLLEKKKRSRCRRA